MLTITYKQATHTQVRFTSHNTAHIVYTKDPGHDTSVVRVVKWEIFAPRVTIKPTPLAFWVSMLTNTPPRLPDVTTLSTPTCL